MAKGRRGKSSTNKKEEVIQLDIASWTPRTSIGKRVKAGEISNIDQILDDGIKILEPEIVDVLLPELEAETLSITPTQRSTDSGRKMQFRAVLVMGDKKGHVGIGVGKSEEVKPALEYAMRDARKNMVRVRMGCGSWECKCGTAHSVPQRLAGKYGATTITLKPAPKGLGIAANTVVRKVLSIAGLRDVWSSALGSTSNVYNTAMATVEALDSINKRKPQPGEAI
ncbi:MAG TPA: 30S ribosomal protein S5 [Candidatus Bilamarchaeaceae archaeon]|nr:30S ribosomal protein S5 [Candidatus Bilamarchaeaceae archaeon]